MKVRQALSLVGFSAQWSEVHRAEKRYINPSNGRFGYFDGKLGKCIVSGLHLHLHWSRHILYGHKEP